MRKLCIFHPARHFRGAKLPLFAFFTAYLTLTGCSPDSSSDKHAAGTQQKPGAMVTDFAQFTAKSYKSRCEDDYAATEALYQQIAKGKYKGDDRALLRDINELDRQLDNALGGNGLFSNAHPDADVREAAEACQQRFVSLLSEISLSRPIYDQIAAVDTSAFDAIDKRFVEDRLRDLRRSGVNLDEAGRATVKQLNDDILQLGQTFSKNVREDVRTLNIESADTLQGLPQDYIDAHPANEDGSITLTTNYPDYYPAMQYAKDDAFRLAFYKIFRKRAHPQNENILRSLLEKRYTLARLLGYDNYADYITETLMIQSPDKAQNFIDKIDTIAQSKAQQEYNELLEKLQQQDPKATAVGDWQKTYLSEQIKKEKYQVDAQEIRQYFPYKHVKQGVFDLVETMFEVKIQPWDTEVWHPSVEAYELLDGGEVIGRFYLDMHPRDGKYKHAAAFSINEGLQGVQLPRHALVCNFPGEASGDELMEHDQVETFLHEFGHLLHGLFGGHQRWLAHAGTSTERDFVEAPSQMLEEWVWDKDTLKTFAKNAEGETIPDALIEKMRAARNYSKGLFTRHQMYYAAISLHFYNRNPLSLNMVDALSTLKPKYSNFGYVEDTHFHESFGHLYGYSAVYYTYMWSLVIASDMFSEFQKHGLRNPEIAKRYREKVLAPGGSKDANTLVNDFLGRDYNFDAFAESLTVE